MLPYLVACGLLLVASVFARALPLTPCVPDHDSDWFADEPWHPRAVAYLRRGCYGVVLTVLAELHALGAVDVAAPRAPRPLDPPAGGFDDALQAAVHSGSRWRPDPRLLALLPSVRRHCRALRAELVDRGLLAPARRRACAIALLGYAVGFAAAAVVENGFGRSTVVSAASVTGLAALSCAGPRRTVAGHRVLRAEGRLLARLVTAGDMRFALTLTMVAMHGPTGLDVLCSRYLPAGALTGRPERVPAVSQPAPSDAPARISIRIPPPVPARAVARARRWVPTEPVLYDPVSEGPAIVVRPAFARPRDRVAA